MRVVALLASVTFATAGLAQETPLSDQNRGPYGTAPGATPSPTTIEPPPPPLPVSPLRHPPPESAMTRWRHARALSIAGDLVGLAGTGLSISSTIYVLATGWPPSASDLTHHASPTDTGAILAYAGSSASVLGFAMSAGGLGWQHNLLRELGADPGRGLYGSGVAVGLIGLLGVATSYYFGFTSTLNPHDQGVAVLASSLSGAAVCTIASIMLAKDSSNLKEAWQRLLTF